LAARQGAGIKLGWEHYVGLEGVVVGMDGLGASAPAEVLYQEFGLTAGQEVSIPDEAGSPALSITFGVLKAAQALGDRQALLDAGRRVIRFHQGEDVVGGLKKLTESLS
jgi:hypothetical protein